MACRQIFQSRASNGSTALDAPNYSSPTNAASWLTGAPAQPWLIDGTAKELAIRVASAPGAGKSWTATLEVNGSDTALTCTIADANTTASVTIDVALPANCTFRLRRDSSGTPTVVDFFTTFVIDGASAGESGHGTTGTGINTTGAHSLFSGFNANASTSKGSVVAVDGQITGWSVNLDAAVTGGSYTAGFYKAGVLQDGSGGTIDTTQTIDNAAGTSVSWSGSLTVAKGSQAYWDVVVASGAPTNPVAGFAISFLATTDGESNVGHVADANMPTTSGDFFATPTQAASAADWSATETDHEVYNDSSYAFDLRGIYVAVRGASVSDLTFSVRQNGADASGGPSATVAAGGQTAADTTNSFTVAAGDRWCFKDSQAGNAGIAHRGSCSCAMYAVVADSSPADGGDVSTPAVITIQGVDYTPYIRFKNGIDVTLLLNDRSTAQFDLLPLRYLPGGTIPPRFQDVVIYDLDGLTPLFGGLMLTRETAAPDERTGLPQYYPRCRCVDYFVYFDWTVIESISFDTAVSLKTVLQAILDELPAGYGITLDAAQPDGPDIDPFSKQNVTPSDLIRDLSQTTGYIASISPFKALKMVTPGTDAAPFNISDAAPHCREFTWRDPDKVPVTKLVLAIGPDQPTDVTQTWEATAGQTAFVTDFPATNVNAVFGYVTVTSPSFSPNEPRYCTVGVPGDTAMFTWDVDTHTLTVDTYDDTFGALDGTETLEFVYTAAFPYDITVYSSSPPASPEVAAFKRDDTILTLAEGIAKAQGYLAELGGVSRQADILTREDGWRPGQSFTANLTDRDVNATFTVTEVRVHMTTPEFWEWQLTAQETTTYQGNYLDRWRELFGGGSSSDGAGTPSAASSTPSAALGASGGITELTGDVTAGPGSGAQAATLAASGVTAATYGSATKSPVLVIDAKGRVTSASEATISGSGTVTTTGSPANGNLAKFSGATSITNADLTGDVTTSGGVATTAKTALKTRAITFAMDGGGSALTTGAKADVRIPFDCTIQSATLLADQSGSVVVDIWKDTYANFPPTVADTITASAKPTLSSATKSEDTTLTGWTTSISAGDTLRFNIDSVSTITKLNLTLKVAV